MQTFPNIPVATPTTFLVNVAYAGNMPIRTRTGCTGLYGQSGYGISDDALSLCYIRS